MISSYHWNLLIKYPPKEKSLKLNKSIKGPQINYRMIAYLKSKDGEKNEATKTSNVWRKNSQLICLQWLRAFLHFIYFFHMTPQETSSSHEAFNLLFLCGIHTYIIHHFVIFLPSNLFSIQKSCTIIIFIIAQHQLLTFLYIVLSFLVHYRKIASSFWKHKYSFIPFIPVPMVKSLEALILHLQSH